MRRAGAWGCVVLAAIITMAGCGSSGPEIPFVRTDADYSQLPVETVRSIASELEQHVASEEREPVLEERADFVADTPEIRQALRSRAARYTLVQDLLDSGFMMEQRNGKITVLRSSAYKRATTARDRDRHALIVISENRDRVTIHESLQKANNLSPQSRVAIEEIFAQERISRLKPGQKYEGDNGEPMDN